MRNLLEIEFGNNNGILLLFGYIFEFILLLSLFIESVVLSIDLNEIKSVLFDVYLMKFLFSSDLSAYFIKFSIRYHLENYHI
jgi:hypothetical protein